MHKPILVTSGEPAGIGPDILLMVASGALPHPIVALGSEQLLKDRAAKLGLDVNIIPYETSPTLHQPGTLPVIDIPLTDEVWPGKLNVNNASYVLDMLTLAGKYCLDHTFSALVTCPVQKSILSEAGEHFSGHTEFFANLCQTKNTVMMLANRELKVGLMTTHLPLKDVPTAITQAMIIDKVKIIHQDLISRFGIAFPQLRLCGLNPHAGEEGHIGTEEIEIINPAAEYLRTSMGINISNAIPADTAFTHEQRQTADVIVAMYHDQGLPVIKALGFGACTNITLGLPIIRTSVDHGTALHIAGSGKAKANSLYETILLTAKLIKTHD